MYKNLIQYQTYIEFSLYKGNHYLHAISNIYMALLVFILIHKISCHDFMIIYDLFETPRLNLNQFLDILN